AKATQKQCPILIIKKDRIPRIAACSDVIDCAGKLKSKGSCHGRRLACQKPLSQDLTLLGEPESYKSQDTL
ncbi:MAG: hypothetical protein ACOY4D_02885, partial [Pseudomonadota bacterium]